MIVFREEEPGRYDLMIDGRAAEYDVEPDDFQAALRRRRVNLREHSVFVEDTTGYRTRMR